MDTCGDEASIGQVHGAHPVAGRDRVLTEVLVPIDEPRHEHLLGHVNVDEQVDPLTRRTPTPRLQREVVALSDDDAGAADDAPGRHGLVHVASVDRGEDLWGAVGPHPVQGRQVALDVEGVRRTLAVVAPQLVQDGVGQVEAVHGDQPGEDASRFQLGHQLLGNR